MCCVGALLLAGSTGAPQAPSGFRHVAFAVDGPSPPVADKSGFVESDGYRIYYEAYGEGGPILLIHGWGGSTGECIETGWLEMLRPLRRVIAIDHRGHGASDKPHEQAAYSYEQLSHDVLNVMDHLGIATADLFGYSLGAFTGAVLLRTAPQRFTSMILGGFGSGTADNLAILPKIVAGLRAEDANRPRSG